MTQIKLDNGLVKLENGSTGITDDRNNQRYMVAIVKPRDIVYFKDYIKE